MSTTKRPSSAASSSDPTLEDGSLATGHEAYSGPTVSIETRLDTEKAQAGASTSESLQDALDDDAWLTCPHNPYTWSLTKKWTMASVVSLYTFVSQVPPFLLLIPLTSSDRPLASSMLAPGLPAIAIKYNIANSTLAAMPLSIFILAYAFGPLIISPLSEIYGRKWVLHLSNICFLIFNLFCAWAPNTAALIVFRFFSGIGGSTPVAIGGSVISDMFRPEERAAAMAIYTMGPLIGPVIGPIAGGFIAETIGFKWVFIIISIIGGVASVLGILLLRETYHPILRARLVKQCVSDNQKAKQLVDTTGDGLSKREILWINMTRPIAMCKSFILFILSLFMAIQYGNLYLMFATFPDLFPKVYGFSAGITGLMYLGFGIGFLAATIFGATFSNTVYRKLAARNGGVGKPEFRMPTMLVGSVLVPVGLFWFGWSARASVHWIVPVIGSGVFGAGMMLTFLPIQLYLVDAFKYAASALAAASVFRALFGFAFPLFAEEMFEALTIGGGYSFLAGIAILVGWPFPVWIYFYGERIRGMSNLNR